MRYLILFTLSLSFSGTLLASDFCEFKPVNNQNEYTDILQNVSQI